MNSCICMEYDAVSMYEEKYLWKYCVYGSSSGPTRYYKCPYSSYQCRYDTSS